VSKTERALHEPGLDDAPDDAQFVDGSDTQADSSGQIVDGGVLDDLETELSSNGELPAPTMGFAPPTADESLAESTTNGHVDADVAETDGIDPDGLDDQLAGDDRDDDDLAGDDLAGDGEADDRLADDRLAGDDRDDDDLADEMADDGDPDLDPGVAKSIGELFDDEPDGSPAGLPAPYLESDLDTDVDTGPDDGLATGIDDDTDRDGEPGDPSSDHDGQDGPDRGDGPHPQVAAVIPGEALRVSPPGADVLEELRTAKVDGPTVEVAPQDDDTGYNVRRPQRLREYDPAPIPIPAKVPRLLGRKPRVRKVTRVVRHVDPWSVFKIAIIANLVLYVIMLTAGVLLWNVANATGTVDNVERFFESFGWSSFEFNGGEIYHSAWIAGLFFVVGLTGAAVLLATLFNLITDLVGGMRFTVLEEEVVETRTSPMRRFVVRRPEPEVPAIDHDESGPIVREAVVDDSGAIVRRTR
jgi:hypothetical protein